MFNSNLRKEALVIHESAVKRYNISRENMLKKSSDLYATRVKAVELIETIKGFIDTIKNTPSEFNTKMGLIKQEIIKFKKTEEYAEEALKSEIKSGVNIAAGAAAGTAFASMAPTAAMGIATTFGTASTGTAISTLSRAAAQKAALAWLGGGALSAGGAGIAGGKALLALAGPIGWSISAASVGVSLISMSSKNKEIADQAISEAKKVMNARELLDETSAKIDDLYKKTNLLITGLVEKYDVVKRFRAVDYRTLNEENKKLLGAIVNNTYSLASLVNETIQ